jgi:hypothetical protein
MSQTSCCAALPCAVASGIDSLWPKLVSLEVCGWALDAGSISAIKQLEGLAHINLQGGRDPGTALHARLLLPLLDKPGLSKLVLREVRRQQPGSQALVTTPFFRLFCPGLFKHDDAGRSAPKSYKTRNFPEVAL